MKARRQALILELVDREPLHSQEQVRRRLHMKGFVATQATISRDIKDLGLVKRAGKLEFKIVDEAMSNSNEKPEVQNLVASVRTENGIPEGYTEEIVGEINEALKGKIQAEDEIAFEVFYDKDTKKISGGRPYLLKKRVDVSGEMLASANVSFEQNEPFAEGFRPGDAAGDCGNEQHRKKSHERPEARHAGRRELAEQNIPHIKGSGKQQVERAFAAFRTQHVSREKTAAAAKRERPANDNVEYQRAVGGAGRVNGKLRKPEQDGQANHD